MRIKSVCLSLLVSIVLTVLMLVATAFCMYKWGLSGVGVSICVVAIYVVSNFVGGFLLGKCAKSRRFLWGILLATGYFVFYLLLGAGVPSNEGVGIGNAVITYIIIASSGMLGGMVSV